MATILATETNSVEATSHCATSWQSALKNACRSGHELRSLLELPQQNSEAAEQDFPVLVPHEYIARMETGNANDPLLRQVWPDPTEVDSTVQSSGLRDPVGDLPNAISGGLLQKYAHRVLLVSTGVCGVNCRYCFRRHFPYEEIEKGRSGLQATLDNLRGDASIHEIILSGGDPLTLNDSLLSWFVDSLKNIGHVRRLRIHTRLPVVIPQRICESLLQWVYNAAPAVYFVLHFNHANEIDTNMRSYLRQLHLAGASLLNQAVLLQGVNDSFEAQLQLCNRLIDSHVLPYYLHQLDRVTGALHFEASVSQGKAIIGKLREHLPGYAVPSFVQEIPGEPSKTPL